MVNQSRVILVVAIGVALAVGIGMGVLIGWFSGPDRVPEVYVDARRAADGTIAKKLIQEMKAKNVRDVLWGLTQDPHVAGTPQNKKLADDIHRNWTSYGFEVTTHTYNVLLSFPSTVEGEDNVVQILNSNGSVDFTSQLKELPLDDLSKQKQDSILPPFNAYSAQGNITSDLVYVNYARVEDFQFLERNMSINVTGKIVIARYGKLYRGDKAKFAAQFGAAGLILYSDPKDYYVEGGATYPDGIFLPGTGAQRGTCLGGSGDPLTQGYPSVESAYRIPVEDSTMLPTIPIHPIGYDDASELLRRMGGPAVVPDWEGGLNITYRYGPGFEGENADKSVKLTIYTKNQQRDTWDVIGVLRGSVEPDRYVLVGNHRDAWAFGAIDPSSGTASMMELSRAVGVLVKKGWKPRRSIMFCSWGAEEQGLIGSTEWVEEFSKKLGIRAVAYLNLDISVRGTYVPSLYATPSLNGLIYEATKKIPDPAIKGRSMFDTWLERAERTPDNTLPRIGTLGSGSDHAPFVQLAGISALYFTYTYDKKSTPVASYPTYHSVYETFDLVANFYDPDFKFMLAAGQLIGELMRQLADSILLPMDVGDYALAVEGYFESLRDGEIGQRMIQEGLSFEFMESAVNNFTRAAVDFKERLRGLDLNDVLSVRTANDQMMYLERSFIDPMGLTGRPTTRHVVLAPNSKNSYAGQKFAGIVDAMFDIDNNDDPDKWELVKKELAVATYFVQSAAYALEPVA